MKKILIVTSVISFIEWFNKENIFFLKHDLNCEVHVACNIDYTNDTDTEKSIEYVNKAKSDGIYFHNIHFSRSPINIDNIHAYRELKNIIDNYHFDLIHCHTPAASVYTRIAARKSRKDKTTVMYTCHGFHFHKKSPKINWLIYYPIERYLSKYCDYLITICHEDYELAKSFHTKNVRYIPGVGVDINKIKKTKINKPKYKEKLGIPSDSIMLLSIGELINRKNHRIIIEAISKLHNPNLYYVICGKGELKDYLLNLANNLNISDKVVFLGFRNDIAELCNSADIGAFPSIIEGLGVAGIEIMSAGVPLVASNVHGILDYVKDGITGYTCNPNNSNQFAIAIKKLIDNPDTLQQMHKSCIETVKPFEKEHALNEMWKIYREIL